MFENTPPAQLFPRETGEVDRREAPRRWGRVSRGLCIPCPAHPDESRDPGQRPPAQAALDPGLRRDERMMGKRRVHLERTRKCTAPPAQPNHGASSMHPTVRRSRYSPNSFSNSSSVCRSPCTKNPCSSSNAAPVPNPAWVNRNRVPFASGVRSIVAVVCLYNSG